ncbi:MAG: hypothetical protein WBX15_00425 [Thermoanaerobaculia bacterium]
MTTAREQAPALFGLQKWFWAAAAIGVIAMVIGAFVNVDQFLRSYLWAWIFMATISFGCLGILMIQYLTGGVWGTLIRRPLEAAARTIPFVAILIIPIFLGMTHLYEWTHAEVVRHDPVLQIKASYLNEPFFIGRTVFFFALWMTFAFLLNHWARQYEETRSPWTALRLRQVSGIGLPIMGFTLTFASVDWGMSLEPHWTSTMYGLSFLVGCLLNGFAFSIFSLTTACRNPEVSRIVPREKLRDLGNLLLASVMLWAYLAFSEFMLIWYGNLREETPYFIRRAAGWWGFIAGFLIVFHFFLPFFLLLMRRIKDRPSVIRIVAILVLLVHAVDVFWLITPAFLQQGPDPWNTPFHLSWLDFAAWIGLTGLWVGLFLWQLGKRAVFPEGELIEEPEVYSHA